MNNQQHWWFCLKHMAVEDDSGCAGKDRLGPYPSRAAAAGALEKVQERNQDWEQPDRE